MMTDRASQTSTQAHFGPDVVNEQVETWEADGDGIRVTPWLTMLGYDYMDLTFRMVHAAYPQAMLVYHDYALELNADWHAPPQQRVLRLLQDFKSTRTSVHALGIQSYITPDGVFEPAIFTTFLDHVAAMGYAIII
jgi:endo-1,4-beta-xylanase